MSRGRKPITPNVKMIIWAMVELERDRQDPTRERASERDAACRVAKHLETHFLGGRVLDQETIRRHCKDFNKLIRQSNSGETEAVARRLLQNAREKREIFGWETSTWSLVIDYAALEKLGYRVTIHSSPN